MEKDNLVNPLQVVAQLCCFLFNFKYDKKPVRVRHLLLLSFSLSIISSIFFQGIDLKIILLVLFLFIILIYFCPLDLAFLFLFSGYLFDQGLARWGFYLAFFSSTHLLRTLLFFILVDLTFLPYPILKLEHSLPLSSLLSFRPY